MCSNTPFGKKRATSIPLSPTSPDAALKGCDQRPSSQALLLRQRGDLGKVRGTFKASLPRPSATAFPIREGDEVSRIGLQLDFAAAAPRLIVTKVDEHPRRRTPASQWNVTERRETWLPPLEKAGDPEFRAPMELKPGDRIAAVNGIRGCSLAMLAELEQAMDGADPKAVDLQISRDITQVLAPYIDQVRLVANGADALNASRRSAEAVNAEANARILSASASMPALLRPTPPSRSPSDRQSPPSSGYGYRRFSRPSSGSANHRKTSTGGSVMVAAKFMLDLPLRP